MDIKKMLKKDAGLINTRLHGYLNSAGAKSKEIFQAMNYALFPGGKRLRPLLCIEACRACGGNIKNALPAACAIEFVHNFSLIHDDLPSIDNDDYRRGRLTVHRKFSEGIAVLAGDALLVMAFNALSEIKDKTASIRVISIICDSIGLEGMIAGQGLDIKYANRKKSRVLESKINSLKTAKLFMASLVSGGMIAGSGARIMRRLESCGKSLGEAFQIYDDIKDNRYKSGALENKKNYAKILIKKAKSSLDILDKKADNLRYIAERLDGPILDTRFQHRGSRIEKGFLK